MARSYTDLGSGGVEPDTDNRTDSETGRHGENDEQDAGESDSGLGLDGVGQINQSQR